MFLLHMTSCCWSFQQVGGGGRWDLISMVLLQYHCPGIIDALVLFPINLFTCTYHLPLAILLRAFLTVWTIEMYFKALSLHGWWSSFTIYYRHKVLKRFKKSPRRSACECQVVHYKLGNRQKKKKVLRHTIIKISFCILF